MSSSSSSSLSSLAPLLPIPGARPIFVVEEELQEHRILLPEEVAIDSAGNELLVNDSNKYFVLKNFDNQDPQDGDLWTYDGKVFVHLCGVTYEIAKGVVDTWDVGMWDTPGRCWN